MASAKVGCCFSLSPVGSPCDLTGLFRRRIAWEDGAIREPTGAGAVAVLMNRRCRSGEDAGARASSVGKRWGSASFSRACPHAPQGGARSAGCVHILTVWRRDGCRRSLATPSNERGVGPHGGRTPSGHGRCSFATRRGLPARNTSVPRRGVMQGSRAARITPTGAVRSHATAPAPARPRAGHGSSLVLPRQPYHLRPAAGLSGRTAAWAYPDYAELRIGGATSRRAIDIRQDRGRLGEIPVIVDASLGMVEERTGTMGATRSVLAGGGPCLSGRKGVASRPFRLRDKSVGRPSIAIGACRGASWLNISHGAVPGPIVGAAVRPFQPAG